MSWKPVGTVYKKESSVWPGIIAVVIFLIVIGAAIG